MSDVKVKLDQRAINSIQKTAEKSLCLTAEVLRDDIRNAEVVPMETGLLTGEAFNIDTTGASRGVVRLMFNTPYARRLYYHPEYKFNKAFHSNAQGLWLRHWQAGGVWEKRPSQIMAEIIRKGI